MLNSLYSRTAAQFTDLDPIVPKNEFFMEQDTGKVKRGDGMTVWTSLAYWDPEDGDSVSTAAAIATSAGTLVSRVTTTSAALDAIGNAINTADKYVGKMVWNTTTGLPLWADAATAAGTWSLATGVATHSPA